MNKSKQLENFLLTHLEKIEYDGGGGSRPNLPDFELYAFDYLDFAEKRINNIEMYKEDSEELINCIAHLKRAVDCQLDTFFYSINLYRTIADRNIKFDKKLDFLKGIGVFSSRSLGRLNTLRNKMEHQYEVPKISDIELYYDLVSAFISVLQGIILTLMQNQDCEYLIHVDDTTLGEFSSKFDRDCHAVLFEWKLPQDNSKTKLKADITEFKDRKSVV